MREEDGPRKAAETVTSRAYRLLLLHPIRLIRRLLTEHATPRGLGFAAGLGMLVGASPFFGVHSLIILALSRRLRFNLPVALGTNQLCFPPFVPGLCIEAGYFLRHGRFLTEVSFQTLGREVVERFWEWMLGWLVVGPALALVIGLAVWGVAAEVRRQLQRTGADAKPEADPTGQP